MNDRKMTIRRNIEDNGGSKSRGFNGLIIDIDGKDIDIGRYIKADGVKNINPIGNGIKYEVEITMLVDYLDIVDEN